MTTRSIQPLVRLLTKQPHLIVDHVEAYGALLDEEIGRTMSAWKRRTLLAGIAGALVALGVVLGGVGLMLDAVLSAQATGPRWVLWAVPAAPILVAVVCLVVRQRTRAHAFDDVRRELAADWRMLREVSSTERTAAS